MDPAALAVTLLSLLVVLLIATLFEPRREKRTLMKYCLIALTTLALLATLLWPAASFACHSCAGWGQTCGKLLDVAPSPSQGELDALIACDRVKCAVECDSYLDVYDACIASQDVDATVNSMSDDCASCQAGIGQWAGIGCNPELVACSYDLTCCTTCDDWLENGGDVDNLCEQQTGPNSINDSIAVSACACNPAKCGAANKCGPACLPGGNGGKYLEPSLAGFGCGVCLAGATCGASVGACIAN